MNENKIMVVVCACFFCMVSMAGVASSAGAAASRERERVTKAEADTSSAAWVCSRFPERVDSLFGALDLSGAGLEAVRQAVEEGDRVAACKALLEYYRSCDSGAWLRWRSPPEPSDARHETADAVRDDTFTFYRQTDRVPRVDGDLDWTYDGPTDDIQWAMALNRHHHMRTLLRAAGSTGNRAYVRTLDAHIRDWAASVDTPAGKNRAPPWGTGLDVSFRAKRWTAVFFALQDEPLFTPAARLLLLSRLPQHAHYLRHRHAAGNWITMELSGLAAIAAGFPEFRQSAEWLDYAIERLTRELTAQVYPDGAQMELTSGYHWVALRNFEQLAEICRGAGVPLPDAYASGIEKMWHYLACIVQPSGQMVANNDSNHWNFRNRLIDAAELYERDDWAYIAHNGASGERPSYGPSLLFPWAGQCVFRGGWEANALWAFFDIGPWGTGHQHNDKLHLSVSAGGRALLVDSGRFSYSGKHRRFQREYAVLSRAHNVLLLDDRGQDRGPRRTQQPVSTNDCSLSTSAEAAGDGLGFARGACDRFDDVAGTAVHTRAVVHLSEHVLVVADRIETDRPRVVEALWHWHPRCTVAVEDGTIASIDPGAGNLRIVPVSGFEWQIETVRGQEEPRLQGWYAHQYNEWEPNPTSSLTARIDGSTSFAWLLVAGRGDIGMARGEVVASDDEQLRLRVRAPGGDAVSLCVPWRNGRPFVE